MVVKIYLIRNTNDIVPEKSEVSPLRVLVCFDGGNHHSLKNSADVVQINFYSFQFIINLENIFSKEHVNGFCYLFFILDRYSEIWKNFQRHLLIIIINF